MVNMPTYIPSDIEFDSVRGAVQGYASSDFSAHLEFDTFLSAAGRGSARPPLPIRKFVRDFERFVETGDCPPDIQCHQIAPGLLAYPRSLALALGTAVLRPDWDVEEVRNEYCQMRERLLAAWEAHPHNARQMRRKIVDEVVWFGAQQVPGWGLASDVVYHDVFAACAACEPFLEGPPRGAGLIPELTGSWGTSFREELPLHAAKIMSWLERPNVPLNMPRQSFLLCVPSQNGCSIAPGFWEVLPGSKRNFVLQDGSACLVGPHVFSEPVPAGQHLMLRSLDEGESQIQIAKLVVTPTSMYIEGPNLKIPNTEPWGKLEFQEISVLDSWSCLCGAFSCNKRHRLSAWDPESHPPRASLKSFLWTAVKGTGTRGAIKLGEFTAGMYYACLCGGV